MFTLSLLPEDRIKRFFFKLLVSLVDGMRKEKELSLRKLAKLMNVSPTHLRMVLQGDRLAIDLALKAYDLLGGNKAVLELEISASRLAERKSFFFKLSRLEEAAAFLRAADRLPRRKTSTADQNHLDRIFIDLIEELFSHPQEVAQAILMLSELTQLLRTIANSEQGNVVHELKTLINQTNEV